MTEPVKYARKYCHKTGKDYFNINNPKQLCQNLYEAKMGLHKVGNSLEFCDFDSEDCYFRGIADLIVVKYKKTQEIPPTVEIESIEIIDWKTGKSSGDNKQLKCYTLMVYKMLGVSDIISKFVYLDKEKESKEYIFTVDDIKAWEEELIKTVESIRIEENYEPCVGWYCSFCPCKDSCDAKLPLEEKIPGTFLSKILGD